MNKLGLLGALAALAACGDSFSVPVRGDAQVTGDGALSVDAAVDAAVPGDSTVPSDGPIIITGDGTVPMADAAPRDAHPDSQTSSDGAPADVSVPLMDAAPDAFVAMDAGSPTCTPNTPGSTCQTFPQCGCAASMSQPACAVTNLTTGDALCVPAGSTPDGNACTPGGGPQCLIGSACVRGFCTSYCKQMSDCPGSPYRTCAQVAGPTGALVPGDFMCTRACDPVNPGQSDATFTGCGAGLNCQPSDLTSGQSNCFGPTGSGTQGSDCTSGAATSAKPDPTRCAPGFVCQPAPVLNMFQCHHFCHLGSSECGNVGTALRCIPFSNPQYAGPNQIGYCHL